MRVIDEQDVNTDDRKIQEETSANATKLLFFVLFLTPLLMLALMVIVFYKGMLGSDIARNGSAFIGRIDGQAKQDWCISNTRSQLQILLSHVTDALDKFQVQYWILPGLGLFPARDQREGAIGRLNPWQTGVDIGVYQHDLMKVILAQTELQAHGITVIESYFGLRLFPLSGHGYDRHDFRTPFIDIFYFKNESQEYLINGCCDCAPVVISGCTKKTCGCTVCRVRADDIFPLVPIQIEGVQRRVYAPHNFSSLFLPESLENVHASAREWLH